MDRVREQAADKETKELIAAPDNIRCSVKVTTAAGAVPVRAPRVKDMRIDEVTGESAATHVTRLTTQWQDDAAAFSKRRLTGTD